MTSPDEPRTASLYHDSSASPAAVEPAIAAAIVTTAMATYLAVAVLVPRSVVVLAAQAALAAVPIAALIVAARARAERGARGIARDVLAGLGIRGASPRFFVAAIAIGTTAWYLNMCLVAELPITERQTRVLAELVERPALVGALAMFAVVPAICEELLFRGVLARALGRALPTAAAAAISAIVFSAYHLSIAQALPTLTLGFVLALIAIRAGSVAPASAAHAINNGMAIAMSRGELPGLASWLGLHPVLALAGCATATALGIAIVTRGPRAEALRERRPTAGPAPTSPYVQ